mmetsp:Transcript_42124/g.63634  ORF Transcript_42124/g.63634 Transcript_42124/m.63634 type:complete len:401 (-) Transcript_42124:103-1305(-)
MPALLRCSLLREISWAWLYNNPKKSPKQLLQEAGRFATRRSELLHRATCFEQNKAKKKYSTASCLCASKQRAMLRESGEPMGRRLYNMQVLYEEAKSSETAPKQTLRNGVESASSEASRRAQAPAFEAFSVFFCMPSPKCFALMVFRTSSPGFTTTASEPFFLSSLSTTRATFGLLRSTFSTAAGLPTPGFEPVLGFSMAASSRASVSASGASFSSPGFTTTGLDVDVEASLLLSTSATWGSLRSTSSRLAEASWPGLEPVLGLSIEASSRGRLGLASIPSSRGLTTTGLGSFVSLPSLLSMIIATCGEPLLTSSRCADSSLPGFEPVLRFSMPACWRGRPSPGFTTAGPSASPPPSLRTSLTWVEPVSAALLCRSAPGVEPVLGFSMATSSKGRGDEEA